MLFTFRTGQIHCSLYMHIFQFYATIVFLNIAQNTTSHPLQAEQYDLYPNIF